MTKEEGNKVEELCVNLFDYLKNIEGFKNRKITISIEAVEVIKTIAHQQGKEVEIEIELK